MKQFIEFAEAISAKNVGLKFDKDSNEYVKKEYFKNCAPIDVRIERVREAIKEKPCVEFPNSLFAEVLRSLKESVIKNAESRYETLTNLVDQATINLIKSNCNLGIKDAEGLFYSRAEISGRVEKPASYPLTRADLHKRWDDAQIRGAFEAALSRRDFATADSLLARISAEDRADYYLNRDLPQAALKLSDKKFASDTVADFLRTSNHSWRLSARDW